jgi:hypothetical protein
LAEISKIFFSETNELADPKLLMKDHWNVLYQVSVFYANWKSKMATTAGHKLTLDPMPYNVKLSPAVVAILNFISEQKT